MQTVFAKKVNMRPNEVVSQIYHPEFGVVFTNGDTWRSQRKTYVRLLKKSGRRFNRKKFGLSFALRFPTLRKC